MTDAENKNVIDIKFNNTDCEKINNNENNDINSNIIKKINIGVTNDLNNIDNLKKKKKDTANRCFDENCNKKLGLIFFDCKCSNKFCDLHRLPEKHNCMYDYKKNGKLELAAKNPKIIGQKIIKL